MSETTTGPNPRWDGPFQQKLSQSMVDVRPQVSRRSEFTANESMAAYIT
jgi:hypothetical protein